MNYSLKHVFQSLKQSWHISRRSTVIVTREREVRLAKKTKRHPKPFLPHENVLKMVRNTEDVPTEKVDVILTSYVEGLGDKGSVVSVKPLYAHHNLLLPKLAVYASPENLKKFSVKAQENTATYSSLHVPKTLKQLSTFVLSVVMNKDQPWTVEPWHIRTSFRKAGVVVPTEAITLPEKKISGPDLQNQGKEFYVTVTINEREKVIVLCKLHHWSNDIENRVPYVEDFWKIGSEPLFSEDVEVLSKLPRPSPPERLHDE